MIVKHGHTVQKGSYNSDILLKVICLADNEYNMIENFTVGTTEKCIKFKGMQMKLVL